MQNKLFINRKAQSLPAEVLVHPLFVVKYETDPMELDTECGGESRERIRLIHKLLTTYETPVPYNPKYCGFNTPLCFVIANCVRAEFVVDKRVGGEFWIIDDLNMSIDLGPDCLKVLAERNTITHKKHPLNAIFRNHVNALAVRAKADGLIDW